MIKFHYLILGLILAGMGTSLFGFFVTSQVISFGEVKNKYSFVVGRNIEFCYIKGHHRSDLDIIQEFTTIEQCEEYLYSYLKDGN